MPVFDCSTGQTRGHTPAELEAIEVMRAEIAAAVPATVSPRQIRLALLAAGLMEQIDGYIGTVPEATRVEWEYALEMRRDSGLIASAASALGLDGRAIDDLFRSAATL